MSAGSTSPMTTYPIPYITSYTNLGPLPTTITFPPNCQTDAYDFNTNGIGVPWTYYTQGCALSACCPSSHVYSTAFEWYSQYFSPAVCPYGYTTLPAEAIISTGSGETVQFCCPSSFDMPGMTTIPTAMTVPYYPNACQSMSYNLSSTAFVYNGINDQKYRSKEFISSIYYLAYPIQIRWRAGDFDNINTLISTPTSVTAQITTSSSSVSISNPAQISTTGSPSNPTLTPAGSSAASGLATGAIVAIAVVAGCVLLAALGVLVWWLRMRARDRAAGVTTSKSEYGIAAQDDVDHHGPHLATGELATKWYKYELENSEQAKLELEASERAELEARAQERERRVELGG